MTIVTKQFHEHSSVDDNSLFGVKGGSGKKDKTKHQTVSWFWNSLFLSIWPLCVPRQIVPIMTCNYQRVGDFSIQVHTHSLGTVEAWWTSHLFPMFVAIIAGAAHLRVFSVIYCWRTADYASRKLDITSECCLGSFQLHHFCVHLDDLELDFFKDWNELMVCQSISLSWTAHL